MLLTLAASYIIDGAPSATSTLVRHISARVRHGLQQAFNNDIAYIKHSATTSPIASIRRRHCLQQAFDNDIAYSKHSTTSSP
jgi:hypothetical protein